MRILRVPGQCVAASPEKRRKMFGIACITYPSKNDQKDEGKGSLSTTRLAYRTVDIICRDDRKGSGSRVVRHRC